MEIRRLTASEKSNAVTLVWEVFQEFEAPGYSPEGVDTFHRIIHTPETINRLEMYGAFEGQKLTGVLATRSSGTHISLFFVHSEHLRQGIGSKLFRHLTSNSTVEKITVNSSPYAVEVYHRMGFTDTDKELLTDGIRYTPMEYIKSK